MVDEVQNNCVCHSWTACSLKMGPIGCPETSVSKHKWILRNIPEEQKSETDSCSLVKIDGIFTILFSILYQMNTQKYTLRSVALFLIVISFIHLYLHTDMRRLTTAIRSEKCVVRRFRRLANVIQCTNTNLDSTAYYTPRLYGIAYWSLATNLYSMLLYWILQTTVTQ